MEKKTLEPRVLRYLNSNLRREKEDLAKRRLTPEGIMRDVVAQTFWGRKWYALAARSFESLSRFEEMQYETDAVE